MKNIQGLEYKSSSKEERLPGYDECFPYIATRAEFHEYPEAMVPWHWHRPVELFYMESGSLEYSTTKGKTVFPQGWGGFINSNVLHSTQINPRGERTVQMLHIFDPTLIAGERGSRIEEKYIQPLSSGGPEIIALSPDKPEEAEILRDILLAFELREDEWAYELKLREILTDIWLRLYRHSAASPDRDNSIRDRDETIKALMIYIHEHYAEPIPVERLAQSAHISKRVCFRLFSEKLHMSPGEYMRSYRLQKACQLLIKTDTPITEIGYVCGLGSTSYFGKLFRERYDCSPAQFRKRWHNSDSSKQN